jgi:hypothetical protein
MKFLHVCSCGTKIYVDISNISHVYSFTIKVSCLYCQKLNEIVKK